MSRIIFGYGYMRNSTLKHRKVVTILLGLIFAAFVYRSKYFDRPSTNVLALKGDVEPPDAFAESDQIVLPREFSEKELEHLAIGEAALPPLDNEQAVENIIEMEEEILDAVREKSNGSILDNKPVYDEYGNEIGLRFLILSDWEGSPDPPYSTEVQRNVANGMAKVAERIDCSFILSLGDNFDGGVLTNSEDHRFKDSFEDVFKGSSLQRPWYVIAGDKDYHGNVTALMEYTKVSSRWSFKKNYYKMSAHLPAYKNITVDFVMIDTVQLCGIVPSSGSSEQPKRLELDNPINAEKQWSWIEQTLNKSSAEYLIVSGHYPVFSGGRYGSTNCLVDRLQPMLSKYRVSAYFSGHDHSVQHIKANGAGGTHYFVTGAASVQPDRPDHLNEIYKFVRYFWTNNQQRSTGAFAYCDVRKDSMSVGFVHSDQTVIYLTKILPRSHPKNKILHEEEFGYKTPQMKIPVLQQHPSNQKSDIIFQNHRLRPKPPQQLHFEQQRRKEEALQNARNMMHRYGGARP